MLGGVNHESFGTVGFCLLALAGSHSVRSTDQVRSFFQDEDASGSNDVDNQYCQNQAVKVL